MKKLLLTISLGIAAVNTVTAQGLVKFANNANTLVSLASGPSVTTPPGPGFYYALLTAPMGTTDPYAFSFAGIYATNSAATTGGRLQGGSSLGVPVAGWAVGDSREFEVVGWSSDLGATYNAGWLNPLYTDPFSSGILGLSAIGSGVAGGTDSNGASIPALDIFGAYPSLIYGFTIPIPEPSFAGLVAFGVLALWRRSE